MRHDRHGFWLSALDAPVARPPLQGSERADVAVVGGGFTGMWTAWRLREQAPDLDVALVEADVCGHGPSGRNGGFCNSMWFSLPNLVGRFGDEAGLAVCRAADESVRQVGEWCEQQDVDAAYRRGGYLQVATCAAQEGSWAPVLSTLERLGVGGVARELSAAEVAERCASPRLRGGVLFDAAATVDPARLAAGLRARLLAAGVRIYERSPMQRLRRGGQGVRIELDDGTLDASRAVLATGGALLGVRGLRLALTATSSHMVVTEPVPQLLDEIGWTGGECITDSRAMIHYFRTTRDGRIAFGWGGGRIVYGSRLHGRAEVDPGMVEEVGEHLRSFFPGLEGRRIEHAWGGPIDVSPSHLPVIRSLGDRVFAAFGYTGNGVGPSQFVGRALAALALDRRDAYSRLALVDPPRTPVPPEPLRFIGGSLIRRAILRKERLEELGRPPDALTRLVSGIPERLGIHVGR
jgi:glycine/D-amino acid oxidase-like deaminating enzyme